MKVTTIAVDIDGTITASPLHWGGMGTIGRGVWGFLRETRLAERIMRGAKPHPEAVEFLWWADAQGIAINYVTAREERYRELTLDCFREWGVPRPPFDRAAVELRPPGTSVVTHKAACVLGSQLYLEDQLEIAEAVDRRLAAQSDLPAWLDLPACVKPLIIHLTSWQLQGPLLRRLILARPRQGAPEADEIPLE